MNSAPALADRIGRFAASLTWKDVSHRHPGPHARSRAGCAEHRRCRACSRSLSAGRSASGRRTVRTGDGACRRDERPCRDGGIRQRRRRTHALLYEDLNLASADHPGAVIVPAALAAAEAHYVTRDHRGSAARRSGRLRGAAFPRRAGRRRSHRPGFSHDLRFRRGRSRGRGGEGMAAAVRCRSRLPRRSAPTSPAG